MVENSPQPSNLPSKVPFWHQTWVHVLSGTLVVAFIALVFIAEYVVRNAEPILRKSLVLSIEQRFHEPVELDSLSVSVVRGLQVRGEGLRVLSNAVPHQPVASIKVFTFRLTLFDLLHRNARVDTIDVDGLELHIPPHSMHAVIQPKEPRPAVKLTVGKIVCNNVVLLIDTDKPGKQPLQFAIQSITLTDVGAAHPFVYQADLINPKPTGKIHVFGDFGPWNGQEPRATAIDGHYTFMDADLGTIKGLRGTLQSTGQFSGVFGYLTVDGTTETPNFGLDMSSHTMPLHTKFHAYVDGTTGDTTLAPVQARLRNSSFTATGTIMRIPGKGHDIALNVNMPQGRIEDLLLTAMKTDPPVMRGNVTMQTRLHIPPGHESVAQKLQLAGSLKISGVSFSNPKTQDRVDGLSMRAQGKPQQVGSASADRVAEVASQMDVDFTLADAMVKVSSLHYQFPGANVQMDGVYSLDGNVFQFEGHVRTDARASQMVTGWKSALLKPLDSIFAKNGAGLELPVSVNGVKGDVSFGLHDSGATPDQMAAKIRSARGPQGTQKQKQSNVTGPGTWPTIQAMPK